MCLSNASDEKPDDGRPEFFCHTCNVKIEEKEYRDHDNKGHDIQDMNWVDHH